MAGTIEGFVSGVPLDCAAKMGADGRGGLDLAVIVVDGQFVISDFDHASLPGLEIRRLHNYLVFFSAFKQLAQMRKRTPFTRLERRFTN